MEMFPIYETVRTKTILDLKLSSSQSLATQAKKGK